MLLTKKERVFLGLTALTIFSLGCSIFSQSSPVQTVSPNLNEQTLPIETQVSAAIETAQSGGKIFLELTEGQLTAAAAEELAEQGETSVRDLQIRLDDGLMTVSGKVNQNGIELPLTIKLQIQIDADGVPHTQIVSGKLGMFSLPQSLLEQTTSEFDQILQAQLGEDTSSLYVESVGIDNGKLTIVAHPR